MSMNEYLSSRHSDGDIKRLIFESEMLRPITSRMLSAVNVRPGMRVLDIGCGVGGLSRLTADLVGQDGVVIGVDPDERAIEVASFLAGLSNLSNVEFRCCSIEQFEDDKGFDMVVGRCVFLSQLDAVSFLKRAAQFVRPGGYVAFHEVDNRRQYLSEPKVDLWDAVVREILSRFKEDRPQYDIAQRFVTTFSQAGLPVPQLSYEVPVSGGSAPLLCTWASEMLRSLSSDPHQTHLEGGMAVDLDSLNMELQRAISEGRAQVEFLGQACAWAKL
jgi:ubiquinone/menaquinone biosynthesis C-methylase UbiE